MLKLVSQFDPPQARPSQATPTCGGCCSCCCCCCIVSTIAGFVISYKMLGEKNSVLPKQTGETAPLSSPCAPPAAPPAAPPEQALPEKDAQGAECGPPAANLAAAPEAAPKEAAAPGSAVGYIRRSPFFVPIMAIGTVVLAVSLLLDIWAFVNSALFVVGLCFAYYALRREGEEGKPVIAKVLGLTVLIAALMALEAVLMTCLILSF